MNQDEIADRLAPLFGRVLQDELEGIVVLNEDGTNPAESFLYTIPVRIENQSETTYVRYDPLADATAFSDGSPVKLRYNEDGELEAHFDARRGRQAYGGVIPTRNMLFMQHTHESPSTGGQLNASDVFDDGTVPVARGGTNIGSYAVGDIIYASGATTLSKLAGVATGNALISGGVATAPAWGKIGLTTHVSGTLPVGNGGTNITTYTTGDILYASAANVLSKLAVGTNGHVLTLAAGVPTWAAASGGSPFTHSGGLIYPTTTTDNMTLGGSTNIAKLGIIGDTDEPQLLVRGNGTQTEPIVNIENSAAQSLWVIYPNAVGITVAVSISNLFLHSNGTFTVNDTGGDFDSRFAGDNDANLLFLDASTDRVGIGDSTPDGRFAVVGRANEVQGIFRGNGTQTSNILEVQTSAAAVVASVSNAGLISGVQLGLTSGVASTTTPNVLIRDTAQNFGHAKGSGSTGLYTSLNGMYSARTTDTTVTTKTGPGTLIATITVPADFFRVGRQIRYEFSGRGEAGNLDNLMRLVVQDGSTDLIDTRTSTANSTANVRDIKGEVLITCRSVGASGSVWVSARVISSLFSEGGGGRDPNTAADTIDTTTSRTFNIRLYWVGTGTNPPTITVSDDFFDIAG